MNLHYLPKLRRHSRTKQPATTLALKVFKDGQWCTLNTLSTFGGENAARDELRRQADCWHHNCADYFDCKFRIEAVQ